MAGKGRRGTPLRPRLKPTREIVHGVTPFDDLDRETLIRLLCAHHVALCSAKSAMDIGADVEARTRSGGFWTAKLARMARARADYLVEMVRGRSDERRQAVHRSFMRYVGELAFPPSEPDDRPWRLCLGPCKDQWVMSSDGREGCFNMRPGFDPATCPGTRPVTWDDLRASRDDGEEA